jgi:hypothetical protein
MMVKESPEESPESPEESPESPEESLENPESPVNLPDILDIFNFFFHIIPFTYFYSFISFFIIKIS